MIKLSNRNLTFLGILISSIFLLLAVFLIWSNSTTQHFFHDLFYNSDAAYAESLYVDFVVDKGSVGAWQFTPAPYFFPDLLTYFVLRLFVSFPVIYVVMGFVQLLSLAGASA